LKLQAIGLVGLGGSLGAIARYLAGQIVTGRLGDQWPWATFLINVSGCLVIGFFLTLTSGRWVANDAWRYLVPIGFVGAYTTFSTFEYETLRLIETGHAARALSYVLASALAGFVAVWAGAWAARQF
jgi:CrcB protein